MIDYTKLAKVIRHEADKIETDDANQLDRGQGAEVMRALARLLEGRTPYEAFGAPGDWGYSNPIGKALGEAYLQASRTPLKEGEVTKSPASTLG